MSAELGYVAEPHRTWLVSPASKEPDGKVRCHDLSGFLGSWDMRPGGVFFPTLDEACEYATEKNKEVPG